MSNGLDRSMADKQTACALHLVKVVTISNWLDFGRPAPPGGGLRRGGIFLAPPCCSRRVVCASLWALFCSFKKRSTGIRANFFSESVE